MKKIKKYYFFSIGCIAIISGMEPESIEHQNERKYAHVCVQKNKAYANAQYSFQISAINFLALFGCAGQMYYQSHSEIESVDEIPLCLWKTIGSVFGCCGLASCIVGCKECVKYQKLCNELKNL